MTSAELLPHRSHVGHRPHCAKASVADAIGVQRLERLQGQTAHEFSVQEMLPAVGQGIVAVECGARDFTMRQTLSLIDDPLAHDCGDAEREVLWVLNGHSNSAIAGHAEIRGAEMTLAASVLDHAGSRITEASPTGPDRPRELGRVVGLQLLAKAAAQII